jgi:lysozyme family protein
MATFAQFEDILLDHEGNTYVADDHGRGPSKWGITLRTAQECEPGWTADTIQNLTRDQAAAFYEVHFWNRYNIGLLESQEVAGKVCDLAVNVGPGTAIQLLQRAVGTHPDGSWDRRRPRRPTISKSCR